MKKSKFKALKVLLASTLAVMLTSSILAGHVPAVSKQPKKEDFLKTLKAAETAKAPKFKEGEALILYKPNQSTGVKTPAFGADIQTLNSWTFNNPKKAGNTSVSVSLVKSKKLSTK